MELNLADAIKLAEIELEILNLEEKEDHLGGLEAADQARLASLNKEREVCMRKHNPQCRL